MSAKLPESTVPSSMGRQPLFWGLLLLTTALYLPKLTTLTIRGEESRRAVIAREMLESGDWIVPRTQGVVRLSRPPFQNWLIAGTAMVTGGMSTWAVRLPGLAATLVTVTILYWYASRRLSPTGAFLTAVAYASMLQVIEQGRTGETEPILAAVVAGSLLVWHGGLLSGWRPEAYWAAGAAFAALATLTKGLQGPLYFFAATWGYLLLTGRYRLLFTRSHLVGGLVFLTIVGLWQIPFMLKMSVEDGWMIYVSNVAKRFHDDRWSTFVTHFLTYPPSIVVGCLAPWSILYFAYLHPDVRAHLGPRRELLGFCLIATLICLPSVWLPPEARPRYFMPLFPCCAVLVGVAAETLLHLGGPVALRLWRLVTRGTTLVLSLAAAGIVGWSLTATSGVVLPWGPMLGYAMLVVSLTWLTWRDTRVLNEAVAIRSASCVALVLGATYLAPIMTYQELRSIDHPTEIAALRSQLPEGTRLVSFDHAHHLFLHYFGETVELLPWPSPDVGPPRDFEYFCVHVGGTETPELPFAWEPVASLSVDRNWHAVPERRMLVGRVVTERTALRDTSASR
jgi:4-amino-4-deoxy-L-arabinose transferase-like glycosyltransferase